MTPNVRWTDGRKNVHGEREVWFLGLGIFREIHERYLIIRIILNYTFSLDIQRLKLRRYDWTSIHISWEKQLLGVPLTPILTFGMVGGISDVCVRYTPGCDQRFFILVVAMKTDISRWLFFVTFLSPNVGGHVSNILSSGHVNSANPKKVTIAELSGLVPPSFYWIPWKTPAWASGP